VFDARLRRPPQPSADEIELIEAFTPAPRRLPASLITVAGALLALAVLVAIVLSVFVVSEESTRPAFTPAPALTTPTPTTPAPTSTTPTLTPTAPAPTTQPSAELPAPPAPPASLAPLPPVTATAETISTAPAALPAQPSDASETGVRQRLHDLFPRLFPDGSG
jgi:hypothetical protein